MAWRCSPASLNHHSITAQPLPTSFAAAYWVNAKCKQAWDQNLKAGVLDGTIPSAAWDTACTSHSGKPVRPLVFTNHRFTKAFALADGCPAPASNIAVLHHRVRDLSRTVDIVPALRGNSLLSGGKFAESGYISICNGGEVNIYEGLHGKKLAL